jgi:hypothetical protein
MGYWHGVNVAQRILLFGLFHCIAFIIKHAVMMQLTFTHFAIILPLPPAFSVSCRRVDVNFAAVGHAVIEIKDGVVMNKTRDLNDGLGGVGFDAADGSDAVLSVKTNRKGIKSLVAAINVVKPDKYYTVESCPGDGCHVFMEGSEDQV